MKRFGWWAIALLGIASAACGSDATVVGGDGGLGDGSLARDAAGDGSVQNGDGSTGSDATRSDGSQADGSNGDGSVSVTCAAFGGSCTYGAECCSGVCDTKGHSCAFSISQCAPPTAACVGNTDCCSGACVSGQCGATQCLTIGAACPAAGNACCTGNCSGGTCKAIATNPSCVTANNSCTSSAECCSGLCSGGRCAIRSSYCIQTADICYQANDCCGGICSAPDGKAVTATNPGLCSQPSSGGVNCTGVDGSLCPGGNCGSCCSRLCAPYGPTGVNICQPAQGCRVEGDFCRTSSDCCGAAGSGVLGDGAVVCSNTVNGGAVGVCMTPGPTMAGGTCDPEGDVCHYNGSNYTCGVSSKRADCCGPQNPKFLACVLNPFGIPRCNAYTGEPDGGVGCIASGSSCATATDCCGGNPCVPGAGGALKCSASSCQMSGLACTTNADCCAGLPCVAPPGSIQGTCTPVLPPPPPPPSDGGTSDGGTGGDAGFAPDGGFACALYGQSCSSLPCCTGTQCISGKCSTF